jgi:hypothetical protein
MIDSLEEGDARSHGRALEPATRHSFPYKKLCGDDRLAAATDPAVLADFEVQQGHYCPMRT